jgi:hypothetical protein
MSIFKAIVIFIVGFGTAIVSVILLFRPELKEMYAEQELQLLYPEVMEVALLAEQSDEFSFCFRYKAASTNVALLEEKLDKLDYNDSGVLLQMSIGGAEEAISKFNEIDSQKLKYECK